jgi:predicted nucleic acid-binding protein
VHTHDPALVLDTNVVLDWLVFAEPSCAAVGDAVVAGRVRWIACARMRDELAEVLARGLAARRGVDPAALLAAWDRHATPLDTPPGQPLACTDPDDQVFIDLAIAHRAVLLTRDRALLALARRAAPRGVLITPPGRWQP